MNDSAAACGESYLLILAFVCSVRWDVSFAPVGQGPILPSFFEYYERPFEIYSKLPCHPNSAKGSGGVLFAHNRDVQNNLQTIDKQYTNVYNVSKIFRQGSRK